MPQTGWRRAVKIVVDRLFAAGALVLLFPLFAIVSLAVRMALGSPVLFRQQRGGQHGRPITVLKFRTMTGSGTPDSDAQRLTPFGSFLRRTSLDELPQLWNVLRGDVSLVGPRPLLFEYVERYSAEQRRRLDVLPGITGWAQINGRNATTWDERFRLDVWYVDHWSLGLDLLILLRTIGVAFKATDTSHAGHATMPVFRGSERKDD